MLACFLLVCLNLPMLKDCPLTDKSSHSTPNFFGALCLMVVLISPSHAIAEEAVGFYWDCWIEEGESAPTSINCIRDPDSPNYKPAEDSKGGQEEALIAHIHDQLHAGNTTDLGKFIRNNVQVFRRDSVWGISIYSEPYDSSWDEGRPETLVRAILCPGNVPCTVLIIRP